MIELEVLSYLTYLCYFKFLKRGLILFFHFVHKYIVACHLKSSLELRESKKNDDCVLVIYDNIHRCP